MSWLLAAMVVALIGGVRSGHAQPAAASDIYSARIQPIFDNRCIACHSCYNAPCQLNLQSYSGFTRGATRLNVYDGGRKHSVAPTRLDIDGHNVSDWREKGFFGVAAETEPARTLLMQLVTLRARHPTAQPGKQAAESNFCPADGDDGARVAQDTPELGMPYGLPPLSQEEIGTLSDWITGGAPGPTDASLARRRSVPPELETQVRAWEALLNGQTARDRLVARYLYEHLFIAHLYFTAETPSRRPAFFRLVRSRTACEAGVDEIATRRPNDDPGPGDFRYCLSRLDGTIVDKTHIPYALSPQKLDRIRQTFLEPQWDVTSLPGYAEETAANPFVAFADIPVRARYQFLLDDAEYEVSTFIKGPVCNGSIAVNSIQEQFFVLFLRPAADGMVVSAEHARHVRDMLILPGEWGSDVPLLEDIPSLRRLVDNREAYRKVRADEARKLRPNGYTLEDIWNGDGHNPNALLTVFRHFDNAVVTQGAVGDLPKTLLVLDYPLFERLVYNLVINYDVFGNVGHQSLTRLYMDLIRMEAEELFLAFLPPSQRAGLRKSWYHGGPLTDLKLRYVFPLVDSDAPTGIRYHDEANAKAELVEAVINQRLPPQVRGRPDPLNWKTLHLPHDATVAKLTAPEQALRRIASVRAADATPFARFFPELAVVLVRGADGRARSYSLVHNREHENVSWMFAEAERYAPQEDTLSVGAGLLGAYPNMFFVVTEDQVDAFSGAVAGLKSVADYERLVDRFGVRRSNENFWPVFDEISSIH
ncbi:MAG: fatty acid cis/trans isomerase, partial [Xanthobacteraceae bacterium]